MSTAAALRVSPERYAAGYPARYPNSPRPGGQAPAKRPQLRAVEGGKSSRVAPAESPLKAKSSFGFIFLCAVVLISSLVIVLILNTNVIQGSYESAKLQREIAQLDRDIEMKQETLRRNQADLGNKAAELGLVPAENPEVINIAPYVSRVTGEVVGGAAGRGGQ